ncbi:TniB family NTP-binding protein [Clostridium tagluense]|uniref:AAA+ ATPase domain-containing protein n=1 Tax=Clostridium tagluense TaxID=360422 RepID=A0A401UUV0_9CLOT|nr:TniB family NTP-binding protein [Clostridium tagluense]GCD13266.1 hypothetical protein Ctaglu_48890 [Clostridium tagluense]
MINSNNQYKDFTKRVSNIHVIHKKIERIWSMLDSMRDNHNIGDKQNSPRHLFIMGISGVGKSRMMEKYADINPGVIYKDQDDTEIDIKPVVYMEMPHPFTILEFYQSIITALNAPNLPGRPTIGRVKRQAFHLLEFQKVEMLIFDELDYIMESKSVKPMEAMEAIKHVSNMAKVSVVCVGSLKIEELLMLDFQYFRRYPKVKLEGFSECDEEFCLLLKGIENQINSPIQLGLDNLEKGIPQLLFAMCKGFVGILTPILQEAFRISGVYLDDFDDYTKAKVTVENLSKAYENIVGDINEEEFMKIVGSTLK